MRTTEPVNIQKPDKRKRIEDHRRRPGFLPQYSDFYFEKKEENGLSLSILILMFSGFFLGLAQDLDYENTFVNFLLFLCIAQFVLKLLLLVLDEQVKKLNGFYLEKAQIQTDLFFRPYGSIPYDHIREAFQNDKIYYKTEGLVIGRKPEQLTFHYEIGDSVAQKHVQDCYELLQSRLAIPLPPLRTKTFDLLDRRYYYRQCMKKYCLSLFVAFIALCIMHLLYPFSLDGSFTSGLFFGIRITILTIWDLFAIYRFYQSAVFYEKTLAALKTEFHSFPNVRFGHAYAGYVFFYLSVFLFILASCLFIIHF